MDGSSSTSRHSDHDFGVLARHHQATAGADVEFVQQGGDVVLERLSARPHPARRRPCGSGRSSRGTLARSARPSDSETRSDLRSTRRSLARGPNSATRWASLPQSAGERTPAGGATCAPMILNRRPMKLSGVQLAIAMRPPGRVTRSISLAARAWSGANITPKVDSTTSKLASAYGSASTSATSKRTARFSASARSGGLCPAAPARSRWRSRRRSGAPRPAWRCRCRRRRRARVRRHARRPLRRAFRRQSAESCRRRCSRRWPRWPAGAA